MEIKLTPNINNEGILAKNLFNFMLNTFKNNQSDKEVKTLYNRLTNEKGLSEEGIEARLLLVVVLPTLFNEEHIKCLNENINSEKNKNSVLKEVSKLVSDLSWAETTIYKWGFAKTSKFSEKTIDLLRMSTNKMIDIQYSRTQNSQEII